MNMEFYRDFGIEIQKVLRSDDTESSMVESACKQSSYKFLFLQNFFYGLTLFRSLKHYDSYERSWLKLANENDAHNSYCETLSGTIGKLKDNMTSKGKDVRPRNMLLHIITY
jgi:hypothetical protein